MNGKNGNILTFRKMSLIDEKRKRMSKNTCTTIVKSLWHNKDSWIQRSLTRRNIQFRRQNPLPNSKQVFKYLHTMSQEI